jgi:hypothetical protein
MAVMKKRIAIAALVGAISFLSIFVELSVIFSPRHNQNAMLRVAILPEATIFGAISAAVSFVVGFVLTKS